MNKTPTLLISPQKPSPIKETDQEPSMSNDNSYNSPKTRQKKADWRAAKIVEYIYQTHGFDLRMDESIINSWFNLIRKIMDSNHVPRLTHSKPAGAYWDISLSPNSKYYLVFKPFDQNIPNENRMPMEFERMNLFHNN